MISGLAFEAVALVFILGLRHGLDPDHVAVIDGLTLQASEDRPRWAPWIGTFFSIGHSISVAAVAVLVAAFSAKLRIPAWAFTAIDWLIIMLLLLVGMLNLIGLRGGADYRPTGWRDRFLPARLRQSSKPGSVLLIGLVFGLVFDTASQAAAWGTMAAAEGGVEGALILAAAFAAGMILVDTADSQIVARLLAHGGDHARMLAHRRLAGWLIVGLSFGTAAFAIAGRLHVAPDLNAWLWTLSGAAAAFGVAVALAWRRTPIAAD